MRPPAVLAFSLFAIAASLPAEVRECLPMSASCSHRVASQGAGCSRAAMQDSCARHRAATCPKAAPASETKPCGLHPTPPISLRPVPAALAAPVAIALVEPIAEPDASRASRAGWLEARALQPRASPRSTPTSPRPPPFTV